MKKLLGSRLQPAFGGLAVWAVFAVLCLAYAAGSASREQLVTVMLINAVIVVGIQIFTGNTGIVSFGHISLAGIAAYISAILSTPPLAKAAIIPNAPFGLADVSLSPVLGILLAVVVTVVMAAIIGLAINTVSGLTASIVTLALLFVVNAVLTNWKSLTGGAEAFYGIPVVTNKWWVLAALAVAIVAARYFRASPLGLRARAGRDDELAAAAMGVRVVRARYFSWVVSSIFAALGGALLGHLLGAIQPGTFYLSLNFLTLAMLVLGGMNSVTGAIVGTVVVTVGSELARWLGDGPVVLGQHLPELPGLSLLFQGLVILVVMLLKPAGLLGDHEIDWLWRRRRRGAGPRTVTEALKASELTPALEAVSAGMPPAAVSSAAVAGVAPAATAVVVPTAEAVAAPAPGQVPVAGAAPEVAAAAPAPGPAEAAPPVLSVSGATMDFKGLRAVDDASLEVFPREIVGLIGPNGAGKTTLLNVISGVYAPTEGTVSLKDEDITGLSSTHIAWKGVARTFQNIHLFSGLSVRENIEVGTATAAAHRPEHHRTTDELLEQFGLTEVADRKASTLPYGLQREVEMARAVALGPDILLLDEPAAGMNEAESEALIQAVRGIRDGEGCAVLLIDHDLHFVLNLCQRIYVLDAGRVIAVGTPEQIQTEACVIEAYLGTQAGGQPQASPA